jgi:hypothetical protein
MSNQSQHHTEAWLREKTAVLGICELPYLSEDVGRYMGAFEEGDCVLAGDDAELVLVGLREEEGEGTFLVGTQVEDGMLWRDISCGSRDRPGGQYCCSQHTYHCLTWWLVGNNSAHPRNAQVSAE